VKLLINFTSSKQLLTLYIIYVIISYIKNKGEIIMEKIFKTDKGKITLTENNGVIKINNSNGDYIKFMGAKAPFTDFVDDIETHIRSEKEDFGESFDWSVFGTLLNFYSKIADQFQKIEIHSENPLVFSMKDWDKAKEISVSIMERNITRKGDTITTNHKESPQL